MCAEIIINDMYAVPMIDHNDQTFSWNQNFDSKDWKGNEYRLL